MMKHFTKLLIITFLLNVLYGCAKKDPVETIIDDNINHIDIVLDYAKNNFEQTVEIKYLENELESCQIVLNSIKQTYYSQMDNCKSRTNYWRLVAFGLLGLFGIGILLKIKRWL